MPGPGASDALVSDNSSPPEDVVPRSTPGFDVIRPFAVFPADGTARLIPAGSWCIRVYQGAPPQEYTYHLLKYFPESNSDTSSQLDELATRCPEIVVHFTGKVHGIPMGCFYFPSSREAERWLEDQSHALEALGYSIDPSPSPLRHRFRLLRTSFIICPTTPDDTAESPRLLEPAQVVTSVFAESPFVPSVWAECEPFSESCTYC